MDNNCFQTYIWCIRLNLWSTSLSEDLRVVWLVKKFLASYGTRKFIAISKESLTNFYSESYDSSPHPYSLLPHPNIWSAFEALCCSTNMLASHGKYLLGPLNLQAGGPPFIHSPCMLFQNIRSCSPYLEVTPLTLNVMKGHTVAKKGPLNMIWCNVTLYLPFFSTVLYT